MSHADKHDSCCAPTRKKVTRIDGKTLADVYLKRVSVSGDEPAYLVKKDGAFAPITWNEVHSTVLSVVQTYLKNGITLGDRVCIMSNTRPEWNMVDLSNFCVGAVTVPIYQSNSVEDVAFMLTHSGAKLVFAEDQKLYEKLKAAFKINKKEVPTVIFSAEGFTKDENSTLFSDYIAKKVDDPAALEKTIEKTVGNLPPDAVASIVYTSGTTGQPKGVVMTHSNFASEVRSFVDLFDLGGNDRLLAFLPFAHILGRVESTVPLFAGIGLGFAESISAISQNLQELKPTILFSVPRIYEKIYAKIQADVAAGTPTKQKIFHWAIDLGKDAAKLRAERKSIPLKMRLKLAVADNLVFTKIRAKMGGALRFAVSGGAPLSPDLCLFFHACGIAIMEGYGLTETTAAITVNRLDDFSFGTVGKPLGSAELRIASDGEILVRGPTVFKEYYDDVESTKAVFSGDGWFHTGDIGEITARGALRITDRKKELIVTSGGKNIAPQKLENLLKQIPLVSNAMVYGDKQKYLSALITLNEGPAKDWAERAGIRFSGVAELSQHERMVAQLDQDVRNVNKQLASYETIKKFSILPADFTVETGELTPSLKVKRRICVEKFRGYIDGMYE